MSNLITFDDFQKLDIRTGTIIEVNDFLKAIKPSYQLTIDFGPLGIKKSSAQITHLYSKKELLHKQIIAVVNFDVKQIANFKSECLVLGVANERDEIILLKSEKLSINGTQIT